VDNGNRKASLCGFHEFHSISHRKDQRVSTNPYGDVSGGPSPYSAPPQQNQTLAIVSLVCGITGLFPGCCCGLIGIPLSIAALATGGMVLSNPNAGGRGLAIAGVALGGIALLLNIVAIVVQLTNPGAAPQFQFPQN
jgi:hypothetical protein